MQTLGERIRELRDKRDLSLREFARQLGDISPAHVSDIENNRRNPSDELLQRMAGVLGATLEELKAFDNRLPVDELKRAIQNDPRLGFALRKLAEKQISAEDILDFTNKTKGKKT